MRLTSRHYDVADPSEAMELCYARGWTDGLPVVPPTEERIGAMLAASGLEPDAQVAYIENSQVAVSAEKVAINAVLAGCLPEYMPVVVAAVEALADPLYDYHGPATSTGGAAVLMIVNGPIARELDINCGDNLFGPGWRSNATIGRAVRLVMRNVMGTLPGTLDGSTLGHPGKLSYCIAENEAESPWPPLHVDRGFRREQSAVTILPALGVHQFSNDRSSTPEGVLATLCAQMRMSAGTLRQPEHALIFAGEHMAVIAKAGWSRDDVRNYCFEHSQVTLAELKRACMMGGEISDSDETTMMPLTKSPQDFLVVMAGGRAGQQSAFIPGWGRGSSRSVTREIRRA